MQLQRLNNVSGWLWNFDGFRVLVDPWLEGKAVYFNPGFYEIDLPGNAAIPIEEVGPVDLVLISNYLSDHCHPATLAKIDKNTPVVAPKQSLKPLKAAGFTEVYSLDDAVIGKPMLNIKGLKLGITKNVMLRDYLRGIFIQHEKTGLRIFYAPHGSRWDKKNNGKSLDMNGCDIVISTCRYYKLPLIFGGIAQLGKSYAELLVNELRPRYFINTHNSGFEGTGFLASFKGEEVIDKARDIQAEGECQLVDLTLGGTVNLV